MNRRPIALALLILAALVLLSIQTSPAPAPGCEPDRADAVVRGLAYGEGFHAGLYATDLANHEAIATAARNIAATRATIERCGW